MAKTGEIVITKERIPADIWIGRLSALLKVVDEMDEDERRAALAFLKTKYNGQWPHSSDY